MASTMRRSHSDSATAYQNFPYCSSLDPVNEYDAMLVVPEVEPEFYNQPKAIAGPWNHLRHDRDYLSLPSFAILPPADTTDPMHVWSPGSYLSPTSDVSLHYSTTPPSLVDDFESATAQDMSRSPSYASNYSHELGQEAIRIGSSQSSYSFGSDNQGDMYKDPVSSFGPYSSMGSPQPHKHRSSSISSTYLNVPHSSLDMQKSNSLQGSSVSSGSQSRPTEANQIVKTTDGEKRALMPSYQAPYSRKNSRNQKFLCEHCDERPHGFRGEHELTRHNKLRHESTRTMFICQSPADMPTFLDGCKQCRNGKKYGAYYNAVQHVRRCHFAPIKRGRKSKSEASSSTTRNAGQRERNFPAMHDMKKFLREVTTDIEGNVINVGEVKGDHSRANRKISDALNSLHDENESLDDDTFEASLSHTPVHEVQDYGFSQMSSGYPGNEANWASSMENPYNLTSNGQVLQNASLPLVDGQFSQELYHDNFGM